MMLPEKFIIRMQEMLGGEYGAFEEALKEGRYQGLRVNTLKADVQDFRERAPFVLSPVPWTKTGFYYEAAQQPGKHPLHEAGVYYIQEPSAMAPAELAGARPGERILDLCAAPGGKSTQLAAAMKGKGILVCNEIHPARAKILSENIERMGIRNAVVTNETPERLAERFAGFFDKILVDAPCSGEGMFRKNEEACEEWSPENVEMCAARQDTILDSAGQMLRSGGLLVYSTCTFAPQENEGTISRFLKRCPSFSVETPAAVPEGFSYGRPDWIPEPAPGIEGTMRLWPHKLKGEGHFLAVLRKEGQLTDISSFPVRKDGNRGIPERDCGEFPAFAARFLKDWQGGTYVVFGDQLYLLPVGMPSLQGVKVLRPGLHLGTLKKNRFEPSHALALALKPQESCLCAELLSGEEGRDYGPARAWINGETFPCAGEKGWYLICVDGYSIGWGKLAGGMMKNHYPKGLRKNWKQ